MQLFSILLASLLCFPNILGNQKMETEATVSSSFCDEIPVFSHNFCTSSFSGNVTTYELDDNGSMMGHAIWISRKSKQVKAKYFAHQLYGNSVYDRYKSWRPGKDVVLMTSGAYTSKDYIKPVGLTVDNGEIVNNKYHDSMDGLVIVYATGGIVVSNVEDGDLSLKSLGDEDIDVKESVQRRRFLSWAEEETATVFQTHLVIYKNRLQFKSDNGAKAKRKLLVLAKTADGDLFHVLIYSKERLYTLYEIAQGILNYMGSMNMNVIAAINLDTGMFDIIGTGEGAKDCKGNFITGTKNNREQMTNLLSYQFDE